MIAALTFGLASMFLLGVCAGAVFEAIRPGGTIDSREQAAALDEQLDETLHHLDDVLTIAAFPPTSPR